MYSLINLNTRQS